MKARDPKIWAQVKTIAADALEQPAALREQWVREKCQGDAVRVSAVLELLGFADELITEENPPEPRTARFSGKKVDHYQIHWLLGAGGVGEVYLASRTENVRMRVAIKFLRPDCTHPGLVRRFRAEAQILAALDHPNIVKLLDAGETDDKQPYFVMEYVEGRPLDDYCADQELKLSERLRLFGSVCLAVQYAHGHLLVHRDLKPSNIFVSNGGSLKLLDFGIAKLLRPELFAGSIEDNPTAVWDRPLTPGYASPEQLTGGVVTTASDIYSLGVVLFELLTGGLPFRPPTADKWNDFVRSVRQDRPPRPSMAVDAGTARQSGESTPAALSRRLRGDIDNIVLKAIEKSPQRRYLTAQEMADDIARLERGLPVHAHPDSVVYRLGKFASRNIAAIGAAAAICGSLVLGLAITMRERDLANTSLSQVRALAQSMAGTFDQVQDSCLSVLPATKAVGKAEAAAATNPGDTKIEDQLAASYALMIDTLRANHQDAQADVTATKLIQLRTVMARERPQDPSAQEGLVRAMQRYGRPAGTTSGFAGQGQGSGVSATAAQLDDSVALNLAKLGDILKISGDAGGAARAYQSSLSMYRDLLQLDAANKRFKDGLLKAQTALGAANAK